MIARERAHGTFTRRVRLGEALDADHVEARYDDGVLHVTVPVAESAKPHRIEVQSGSAPAVEVGSSN